MWGVKPWAGMPASTTIVLFTADLQNYKIVLKQAIERSKDQIPLQRSMWNYLQWKPPTVVSCQNLEVVLGPVSLFLEFVGKLLAECQVLGLQVVQFLVWHTCEVFLSSV
jgi:hypothetical protein